MKLLPAVAGALAIALLAVSPTQAGVQSYSHDRGLSSVEVANVMRHKITFHRLSVWRWQDRMNRKRSLYRQADRHADGVRLQRLSRYWEHLHYVVRWVRWPRYQATLTPVIGHMAGWLCIHRGEGAWNADTGNGFHGGLQMTYGWMGLVGNAAALTPAEQMTAAEEGYRASGYSNAWMSRQWPNTYPPCAGLF